MLTCSKNRVLWHAVAKSERNFLLKAYTDRDWDSVAVRWTDPEKRKIVLHPAGDECAIVAVAMRVEVCVR